MKKWGGGQLDIRPPQSKNWGNVSPPHPPRIDAPVFDQLWKMNTWEEHQLYVYALVDRV